MSSSILPQAAMRFLYLFAGCVYRLRTATELSRYRAAENTHDNLAHNVFAAHLRPSLPVLHLQVTHLPIERFWLLSTLSPGDLLTCAAISGMWLFV
jgi:hypothetical protein